MWQTIKRKLKGWKTALASGAFFAVGLADFFSMAGLDLKELLGRYVSTKQVGVVMVAVGVLFGALRWYTTSGIGQSDESEDDA